MAGTLCSNQDGLLPDRPVDLHRPIDELYAGAPGVGTNSPKDEVRRVEGMSDNDAARSLRRFS